MIDHEDPNVLLAAARALEHEADVLETLYSGAGAWDINIYERDKAMIGHLHSAALRLRRQAEEKAP